MIAEYFLDLSTLLMSLRLCWLYPLWWGIPTQKYFPGYDTKLYLMVKLQFWSNEECEVTPSLSLFPGPLWPRMVVPFRVSSMGQITIHIWLDHVQKTLLRNNYGAYEGFVMDVVNYWYCWKILRFMSDSFFFLPHSLVIF